MWPWFHCVRVGNFWDMVRTFSSSHWCPTNLLRRKEGVPFWGDLALALPCGIGGERGLLPQPGLLPAAPPQSHPHAQLHMATNTGTIKGRPSPGIQWVGSPIVMLPAQDHRTRTDGPTTCQEEALLGWRGREPYPVCPSLSPWLPQRPQKSFPSPLCPWCQAQDWGQTAQHPPTSLYPSTARTSGHHRKAHEEQEHRDRDQDGRGVGGRGISLSSWIHLEYTFRHRSASEHQLRADRSTWPVEKNIQNHAKLSRMKELGRKTGVLVGQKLPSAGGGTEAGVWSPHWGNCLRQRRNI